MKTAIITGASRGIGLATAEKFISEGWRVVGTYLNTQIPFTHQNLVSVQLDQGNPESIAKETEQIRKIAPKINAVINCAGVVLDGNDEEADVEKIRKTFEVDTLGVIDFTERLAPNIQKGGHIINISSLYSSFSFPIDDNSATGYRIAKTALNMYTRTLAFRLKDKGITVSSLNPGWVKTDMGKSVATETEGPDREPEEPAEEIFKLANSSVETGQFWYRGEKFDW